mgnify:FL=1
MAGAGERMQATRTSSKDGATPSMKDEMSGKSAPPKITFSMDDDTDLVANELEEFYSYVETPLVVENCAGWHEWSEAKWPSLRMDSETPPGSTCDV